MEIGTLAPPWTGTDQDGEQHSSADFLGSKYVLYFYPEDDTPGCTDEACGFRDRYGALSQHIAIIGVSADSIESHKKFREKHDLPFTLISDPDRVIGAAYGIGAEFPKRTTFLIDATGTIRKIYHGFDAKLHAAEVERDLAAFGL